MNNKLETFNYFVEDILSSEAHLFKFELDLLLMQYLFNSDDLEAFIDMDIQEECNIAA